MNWLAGAFIGIWAVGVWCGRWWARADHERWILNQIAEGKRVSDDVKQLQAQLAECLTAAEGWIGREASRPGDWTWTPALQAIIDLRRDYEYVKKIAADFQDRKSSQRPAIPGRDETDKTEEI
jgi:hypothetical protein